MMIVHIDRLAFYQGTAGDELPLRGERMQQLERITAEEPCHRKVTSRTQPSEEKERRSTVRLFRTNSLKEGAV
jgi:hypothetical protein